MNCAGRWTDCEWLGSFSMVFTGGEALLRDDMLDILAYAASKDIRVELLSNSIVVDNQMAIRIVDTSIDQFTTSFDGFKAETHDRFRGGAGYHARTIAAIKAFCTHRQSQKRPLKILLNTVIMR
jgi:MoaA/NifB/PqqE/SkfB family radical SAM enzyme